jgi:rod shape-determining protein MreC
MYRLVAFLQKHYTVILFLILEVFAFTLVVNNNVYQKASFNNGLSSFTGSTFEKWQGVTGYFHLRKQNRLLAEENAALRSQVLEAFRASEKKIFVWNDTVYQLQFQYVSAQIVNSTVNRKKNFFLINKGKNQGIEKDMGVIAPNGVVGMVRNVSSNYALVLPAINLDANISARLKKNDQGGIVSWDGRHFSTGTMKGIPGHIPLKMGDTVITSGQSIFFPEGLPIGYISGFRKNRSDNFYTVDIRFAVDFNSLTNVYIIRNLLAEEQINLLKAIQNEQ